MANLNDRFMQLGLGQGTVRVRVYELPEQDSVELDTPNGALTLLRPGDYRVETFPNDTGTLVIVDGGSLEVSGGGASQTVQAGQAVKLTGTGPIEISFVEPPHPDGFDQWCRERDRRFVAPASARYVSREVPGYRDLDDYGRWREIPPYGPVWYPLDVPVGWMPYRYGHWVWVDPWGWTWVEDETWGFAPFHYGRWVFVGSAWGWVPGPVVVRPYYAPALVAFIGGPHFSIAIGIGRGVGWFPLGPGEPYFPWYHYGGTYLREVNVTNVRNVTNITNITNVTNVNDIHYVNQSAATTVVRTEVFRSGQPVDRQVVPVSRDQVAKAQIIPHPYASPSEGALVGGRPAPNPPRLARPVMILASAQRTLPSGGGRPEVFTRSAPPTLPEASRASRPAPAPEITRNAPPGRGAGPASEPPRTPPPLMTRQTPPRQDLPALTRQQAMQEHPGRALEPQQVENLRAGKPAGPMRDREFPPHATAHERSGQSQRKPEEPSSKAQREPQR